MSILTQNYEISIWSVSAQEETKIAIIGANDMLTPARAQSPQLKRNINGTKTLTFSLYTKYIDEIDGEKKVNPFCNLIHNETRIKLKWKNKWYEFIVKNILEDSEHNRNTYTAEDAFITELSRKGFNIELSTELENNQGTLIELEERILKNSDWEVDKENSIVGPQFKEDVLVKLVTTKELSVFECCQIDSNGALIISTDLVKIPVNSTIYTFYSLLYKKDSFFQFYYNTEYKFGDDGFIINCPIYCIDNHKYNGDLPQNTGSYELTTYKGKQLVRTQKSSFNRVVDKYVKHYIDGSNEEILGYTETEYVVDDFVTNFATNGEKFLSDIGWYPLAGKSEIEFYSYPTAETILDGISKGETIISKSYLKFTELASNDYIFYNSGFEDNKTTIDNLYEGKKFVIRLKYDLKKKGVDDFSKKEIDKTTQTLLSGLNVSLCDYSFNDDGEPVIKEVLFKTSLSGNLENTFKKDGEFWTAICSCNSKYTKNKLLESNIGIFFSYDFTKNSKTITAKNLKNYELFLEEFQFFDYKEKAINDIADEDNRGYYLLGDTVSGEARTKYSYFKSSQEYESIDDIEYEYQGYKEKEYIKVYVENYQQIRSIIEKESNIFNLTQTLCETFETWADFVVEHDNLGYIKKNSKGNFIKKIVFKPFIGKENWSGFHYRTNLKSIQRTTESKQITTKTIVKPNYNEFAPNGFCTIAYADENLSGESFIYDFRYYENQNLIDSKTLLEDLQGEEGLYSKVKELNLQIQTKIDERTDSAARLLYLEKEKEVLSAKQSELATQIASNKKQFKTLTGISYAKFSSGQGQEKMTMEGVKGLFLTIYNDSIELQNVKTEHSKIKKDYTSEYKNYETLRLSAKELTTQKEELILNFETKYAPFIQEGTWISESYIDHNLYYIDAKSVAATSALPQVTYSINVMDLSALEEFKNYDIELGDKTYITDPEFFGYITTGTFYTPRRQEVIISETIEELEEPEKNKFTVQNFKTQFEDIFHRITSTTQQLKLNEGAYQRASGAFNSYGLNSDVAQNSFNSTNFTLTNNTNEWNTQGFITTSAKDKHQLLKIHDGAIMTSKDGTWNKIITAQGINADYIYAGQLDAGRINIVSELKTSEDQSLEYAVTFDKDGLSMYSYEETKKVRLRLGKILEGFDLSEELYGLQLYNSNGEQTFRTDSSGDITISGIINAAGGLIGGWGIESERLVHYTTDDTIDAMISTAIGEAYSVNGYSNNDWRFLLGINGNNANFGVTASGNLFANGVDIKDGNISIGDIFKITSNGGANQAMSYGLNIKLNPENQNEEIVIESDDRVIGIRERTNDGKGWTWKTILGDLTNATLGGKPLSDYELTGYGLCTENGLFSGTIIASRGEIGGWEITESSLIKELQKSDSKSKYLSLDAKKSIIGIKEEDDENVSWKTLLGDLSQVEGLDELDIKGYGLYSENAVISGRIQAEKGQIGGWIIDENYLLKVTTEENGGTETGSRIYLGYEDKSNSSLDKDKFIFKGKPNIVINKIGDNINSSFEVEFNLKPIEISVSEDFEENDIISLKFSLTTDNTELQRTIEDINDFIASTDDLTQWYTIELKPENKKIIVYFNYMFYIQFFSGSDIEDGTTLGIKFDVYKESEEENVFECDREDVFKVPEEFQKKSDGTKHSFNDYVYYKLYNKFPSTLSEMLESTKILLLAVSFISPSSVDDVLSGKDCFIRIYNGTNSSMNYGVDYNGSTKVLLRKSEIGSNYFSSFPSSTSYGALEAFAKESTMKKSFIDWFSIKTEGVDLWKVSLEEEKSTDNHKIESFIIGTQKYFMDENNSPTASTLGVWKFQINKAPTVDSDTGNFSTYSFFFENPKADNDRSSRIYCNLGTTQNPWGHLYLANNKSVVGINTKGKERLILTYNTSNNCVLNYGGYDNSEGETNLYGANMNIVSKQNINLKIESPGDSDYGIVLQNNTRILGLDSEKVKRQIIRYNTNNNLALGYGNYEVATPTDGVTNKRNTNIYGNLVNVYSRKGFYVENTKMHYSAGDTFVLAHTAQSSGYITDSSKRVFIFIPLSKPIFAKKVKVTGKIIIRGIHGYIYDPQNPYDKDDSSKNRINLADASSSRFSVFSSVQENGIIMSLSRIKDSTRTHGDGEPWKTSGGETYTNNTPVSIVGDEHSLLTFTFSDDS